MTTAARAGLIDFVAEARKMLAQPVGELRQERRPGSLLTRSIPETVTACEAAVLMRHHRLSWLDVHDANHEVIGSVDEKCLADVIQLLNTSAYLGADLLAEILPDFDIDELEAQVESLPDLDINEPEARVEAERR